MAAATDNPNLDDLPDDLQTLIDPFKESLDIYSLIKGYWSLWVSTSATPRTVSKVWTSRACFSGQSHLAQTFWGFGAHFLGFRV